MYFAVHPWFSRFHARGYLPGFSFVIALQCSRSCPALISASLETHSRSLATSPSLRSLHLNNDSDGFPQLLSQEDNF
ncbi:hypothetical protein L208DRAFT_1403256 [Tricholoma matsutake]|nr:hypothetical protein L208DRAFT_1403256 [Tricholoma matsutake 945]